MSKLLIVESPKKASHIRHMLGSGWDVKATLGHIRDLPLTGESAYVRPPDFAMRYEILDTKHKEIVAGLRAAAKSAEAVYVATDPDREGEGIAWHVCQVLKIPPKEARRVSYQEVTETAIRKAIQSPRPVNMRLVAAQEARRALDRIVGWEVSPVLSRLLDAKASAGRVQTPALGLIVERERAIKAFKPTAYFQIIAHLPGDKGYWRATWQDGLPDGQYFQDRGFAEALAQVLPSMSLTVKQADSKPVRRAPPPPFTTSTLQMDGSRALRCGAEDIMKAAQALFEAGAITYHRTDSPNLSEEGETMLRKTLAAMNLPVVEKARRWKAKGDAQEAHEAIRPTKSSQENAGDDAMQQALYQLIRKRALASQMPDAVYQQTSCTLDGGTFQNRPAIFKAVGSVLTDQGWKRLYQESDDEDSGTENEAANPVPKLQAGQGLQAGRGEVLNKTTKAPPRYTEATLIKALEDHGVGRPSTYASIIKTLYKRDYMKRKGKAPALYPTELGESVVDALLPFDFAAVDYTREIEESLDKITEGSMNPRVLLEKSYRDLRKTLDEIPQDERNISCPVDGCGGTVRRMESKRQKGRYFWACSNRDAHALLQDDDGKPGVPFAERAPQSPESEGPVCPDCGTPTGKFTTGNGHGYFRCPKGHGSWWDDNGALGKAWEPMPAGKGGKSVKKTPEKTGKPATRKRRSA
ncbi:type I DNA topoisomerase [Acidithiobacillus ferriphilus]|uniref:type I DNA topoisomerase n=1 Tax=Acidithiobacillus ferriphilus TaxID=1689834 RepID=UPI001C063D0D|nr:type I DNA topoisomerase [Acidithiobacillus ferriphilus]MBU2784344.1 type I DNA topoisomerase [Acidithiobacillus ferriphilus]